MLIGGLGARDVRLLRRDWLLCGDPLVSASQSLSSELDGFQRILPRQGSTLGRGTQTPSVPASQVPEFTSSPSCSSSGPILILLSPSGHPTLPTQGQSLSALQLRGGGSYLPAQSWGGDPGIEPPRGASPDRTPSAWQCGWRSLQWDVGGQLSPRVAAARGPALPGRPSRPLHPRGLLA